MLTRVMCVHITVLLFSQGFFSPLCYFSSSKACLHFLLLLNSVMQSNGASSQPPWGKCMEKGRREVRKGWDTLLPGTCGLGLGTT